MEGIEVLLYNLAEFYNQNVTLEQLEDYANSHTGEGQRVLSLAVEYIRTKNLKNSTFIYSISNVILQDIMDHINTDHPRS